MEFYITKPSPTSDIWFYVTCLFLITLMVFLIILIISSKKYYLKISDNQLTIKSIFYNTNLDLVDIKIDKIKIIDMDNTDIKIKFRLNGVGLSGLNIGWFTGFGKKYKLYLTDRHNVLYIPTNKGYTILFSTLDGQKIIDQLSS